MHSVVKTLSHRRVPPALRRLSLLLSEPCVTSAVAAAIFSHQLTRLVRHSGFHILRAASIFESVEVTPGVTSRLSMSAVLHDRRPPPEVIVRSILEEQHVFAGLAQCK